METNILPLNYAPNNRTIERSVVLFLCFFVQCALSAVLAEFLHFQLYLGRLLGLMGKVVYLLAHAALNFGKWFLFCWHNPTNYEFIRIYEYDLSVLEPRPGIEPGTSFLPRKRSATELSRQICAWRGIRTPVARRRDVYSVVQLTALPSTH